MRRSFWALFLALALSLPLGLHAAEEKKSDASKEVEAINYNTRTAKVLEIDYPKRTLVLEGEGGTRLDLKVDPKVKNFNNIKKGDTVKVQTTEALALNLSKKERGEKPSAGVVTEKETAPVGSKPGMEQVETAEISAEVVKVDKTTSTVELKGPAGNILALKAKDPKHLEGLKKGDMVTATYTVAMAISVEPSK